MCAYVILIFLFVILALVYKDVYLFLISLWIGGMSFVYKMGGFVIAMNALLFIYVFALVYEHLKIKRKVEKERLHK